MIQNIHNIIFSASYSFIEQSTSIIRMSTNFDHDHLSLRDQ